MVVTLVIGSLATVGSYFRSPFLGILLVLAVVQSVALYWRRSRPTAVLVATVVPILIAVPLTPDNNFAGPGLIFASYAASAYGPRNIRLGLVVIALALVLTGVGLLLINEFRITRSVLPAGVTTLVAWVAGDYIRSRREAFRDMMAQHEQERAQAAEDERLRIARELHDVVAHNVSLMAIQAGAARVSGTAAPEALQSIETTARDTLSELGRLLGVLRKQPDAPLAPQPGLGQVDGLLKAVRDAGVEATLRVSGDARQLPAALDLSAYRIVQEAITNVLKHAGASRVEVSVERSPSKLVIAISDNGSGTAEKDLHATGHGLIGMKERVDLFGGELTTGASSLGGFTVRATLPIK